MPNRDRRFSRSVEGRISSSSFQISAFAPTANSGRRMVVAWGYGPGAVAGVDRVSFMGSYRGFVMVKMKECVIPGLRRSGTVGEADDPVPTLGRICMVGI